MEYTKFKIKELIEKSEDKSLLLPNFQRDYVWERSTNQKELLASILYDIPIGSLLTLNGESDFFATKELCIRKPFTNSNRDTTLYLLDGQQRISTIKSMFFDFFHDPDTWRDFFDNMYSGLRSRWFLRVIPNDKEVDIFGWKSLKFKGVVELNKYSPKDISEFIKYEIIYPNKSDQWFHPEYKKMNGMIKMIER